MHCLRLGYVLAGKYHAVTKLVELLGCHCQHAIGSPTLKEPQLLAMEKLGNQNPARATSLDVNIK
jgi:hypothetical protein